MRSRRPLAMPAAGLLCIFALGVVALSCTGDDGAAPETTPATASPAPVPTATPADPTATPVTSTAGQPTATPDPRLGLPVDAWRRAELSMRLTHASELISVDGRFFVVGNAVGSGGNQSGMWMSDDGISWEESLTFARRLPEDQFVLVRDVAATDDGRLVAVAERSDPGEHVVSAHHELVAFRSSDNGASWSETSVGEWDSLDRRELDPVGFAGNDPDVLFTVESRWLESADTSVWVFDDAQGWERSEPDEAGLANAAVAAMAATDDGYVAVGFTIEPDCSTQALWRSDDARSWTRVWQHDEPCRWFEVDDLFELDDELFAIGNDPDLVECDLSIGECPPFEAPLHVWRVLGDALDEIDLMPPEVSDVLLSDLAVVGDNLVAVGVIVGDVWDLTDDQIRIWTSGDAHTWHPADIAAEDLTNATVTQVAGNDDRIVALAVEVTPFGYANAHAWTRPMEDPPE